MQDKVNNVDFDDKIVIKVVGVGGSGINAINCMVNAGMNGIDFITVDTDKMALSQSVSSVCIPLISRFEEGYESVGCTNGDLAISTKVAEENREKILETLEGADIVFIVAGMGGSTGTGASPVVAECAKAVGALTIAVVTSPFCYEGNVCSKYAEVGIENLCQHVDTTISISNDRVLAAIGKHPSSTDAFEIIDDIIRQGVQSISDLVNDYGYVSLDLNDIKNVMSNAGMAYMCIGEAYGDNAPVVAIQNAVRSKLMEEPVSGARSIIINFVGKPVNLNLMALNEAAQSIVEQVHPEANIIWGTSVDDTLGDIIKVVVVATNYEREESNTAFLEKRAKEENIDIPKEALAYIAIHANNMREMEGALCRIVAYSELLNEKITMDLVCDALKDVYPEIENHHKCNSKKSFSNEAGCDAKE